MRESQWLIPIQGSNDQLELLSKIFTEEPAKIQTLHDGYFLTGGFLDGLTEATVVINRLELMLGAARIESGDDSLSAGLSGMVYRRDENGSIGKTSLLGAASVAIGSPVRLSFDGPGASRSYIKAAESCLHLDSAVRLWADADRTWPRLFRIVEEINVSFRNRINEYPSDVLFGYGLIDSKEDYWRFINSANEAQHAGKDSRHAMDNNKTPKQARKLDNPYLTHAEAVSFVRECLKRALGHRSNPPDEH